MAKKTERERTIEHIKKKAGEKISDLAARAVENVAETGQSASFSVTSKIETTDEANQVKVVVNGRITLASGQETEHMSLEHQVTMEED